MIICRIHAKRGKVGKVMELVGIQRERISICRFFYVLYVHLMYFKQNIEVQNLRIGKIGIKFQNFLESII